MYRLRDNIIVNGEKYWTLFDERFKYTYITEKSLKGIPVSAMSKIKTAVFGGKIHILEKKCTLNMIINNRRMLDLAIVIDEIGKDEDNNEIDILIGNLAIQRLFKN